ncbi:hypothetical protein [Pseudobacter ginsenosidimutans]|nr:hypothetical protein [Pseudobacter ginsenosidimutans]QEC40226.1 hypothetical protein FSB84_00405 [Pseudobacter ginsenosidimutans]
MQSDNIPVENRWGVNSFVALRWYWQWLAFSVLALVLYLPVLGNTFLSDDHLVLLKTGVEQQLNVDGFFRPLSDITLWLTFRLFGINPLPYYLFQVLLHALNAVMLLRYCSKMMLRCQVSDDKVFLIALLASVLFLVYPFHNEAIAWILGRGALMAGSFAIAAMLALVSNREPSVKIAVIAACYFIGMTAYETIIILPLMVVVQMIIMKEPAKQVLNMLIALVISFALHAWLRIEVSGAFLGGYGEGFFQEAGGDKLMVVLKSAGRVLLPPSDNSRMMMIRFAVALIMVGGVLFIAWKRTRKEVVSRRFFYVHLFCFAVAMLVPMWLGVSTRTSESDRFLYLPSFFFCSVLAFGLVHFFRQAKQRVIIVALLLFVMVALLEENNANWKRASGAVRQLMGEVKKAAALPGRLLVVNLPGETNGAYIFRVGFEEAIRLYQYDSSKVKVVNTLSRDEELMLPEQQVRLIAERPDMLLVQPSTLLFKTDHNHDNELLESSAEAGDLRRLVETMITLENEWSFASAARANQIRMIVYRHKLTWSNMRIGVLHPEDRYLIWNLRGWECPAF